MEMPVRSVARWSSTLRPLGPAVRTLLVVVAGLGSASCDGSPVAEPDPPQVVLEWQVGHTVLGAAQGVLSPTSISVTARTPEGDPVPDHEITWTLPEGATGKVGRAWSSCQRCSEWDFPDFGNEFTLSTDADGRAAATWVLGSEVGEQRIEVTATGAEPVQGRIEARAGVILVGVWTLANAEDQARLPSDTIRVHATNFHPLLLGVTLENVAEGVGPSLTGRTMSGAGFDPNWNFHLSPSLAYARWVSWWTVWPCWTTPFVIESELGRFLGDQYSSWYGPCSGVIRVVGVEEVPASFDALQLASGNAGEETP